MENKKVKHDASRMEETPGSPDANRPEKTFRVEDVHASIFARVHNARTYRSVSLTRGYRDSAGKINYTRNFDPECLGRLTQVIQQAAEWLQGQQQEAA